MDNLAIVYDAEGKRAQAEALFTQTLDAERRVLGPPPSRYAPDHGQPGHRL